MPEKETLGAWVTKADRALVEAAAESAGASVSAYARDRLRDAALRDLRRHVESDGQEGDGGE